jgi:beta-glucosidase
MQTGQISGSHSGHFTSTQIDYFYYSKSPTMSKRSFYSCILLFLFAGCQAPEQKAPVYDFPFQDPSLDRTERVNDLVSRLSLEEKASLMLYNSPAIERLGIPEYNWWNECLHGVGRAGKATVFPQAIGLAATFDEQLIFDVATAISDEARAKYHAAIKKGNRAQYAGLSFWTPNINIFRDPRWGRGQETYGEDPYLTSRIGIAFVRGLQGNDPDYLKTSACAKHYVVHSGPEKIRHHFNALPSERDFRETYLPAFQALVQEGKVESVMCAYNRTYDEPCCGSGYLLNDILREEWGFQGHIVSDCWALDDIWARHKVVEEKIEAAAMAAMAGVNLNCGYIFEYLPEAVEKGLIDENTVDEILHPLLMTRFRLGLFDPDDKVPFTSIKPEVVNSEKHRNLAYDAASKSIVLLKNRNQSLPLKKEELKNLLVLGPTAADVTSLLGNYNGFSGELTTFLEGIVGAVDEGTVVEYNQGFMFHNDTLFHGFWQAARADAVVVCIGINSLFEGEEGDAMLNPHGGDRMDIRLPDNQVEYIRRIRERVEDVPIIVVVTGGSAMAIPEITEMADALLFAWYPGEQGGRALADILFGEVNPSGRLPVTFYRSNDDLPPFEDYRMEGRTYKYFRGEPLFPFGYGLSYSTFNYSSLNTDKDIYSPNDTLLVTCEVNNNNVAGEEVVQLYVLEKDGPEGSANKLLIGFDRIYLDPEQSGTVTFTVPLSRMAGWDSDRKAYVLYPGTYSLQVGASSKDVKLETQLEIR